MRQLTVMTGAASNDAPLWWMTTGRDGGSAGGPSSAPEGTSDTGISSPPRVLIVEDDWFVAADSEAILTDAGYEVVGVAATEVEALRMAETGAPDLVIMDIRLRGDDGIDIAGTLLARFGLRCIFSTAYGDPTTRKRAESVRPLGWVTKPYGLTHLLSVVEEALQHLAKQ